MMTRAEHDYLEIEAVRLQLAIATEKARLELFATSLRELMADYEAILHRMFIIDERGAPMPALYQAEAGLSDEFQLDIENDLGRPLTDRQALDIDEFLLRNHQTYLSIEGIIDLFVTNPVPHEVQGVLAFDGGEL